MIERVGVYAIERELGRGGMGVVYAGRAPTGDPVAIKVLLDAELDVAVRLRFETEIAACARLLHPNVVRLLDAGREHGRPFLVMELLDGVTLAERLQRKGPLPVPEAVSLAAELASGLDAVHANGILHRDLKPSNVMLCPSRPVITDFGLARDPAQERERITVTGEMLGTPAYMAPEQALAQKEEFGPATDVYGLGAVLYHALTGQPPFLGTQLQILMQVIETAPDRPSLLRADVDAGLDEIVLRCLAKRPEDRFPSAGALSEALDDYAFARGSSRGGLNLKLAAILAVVLALGGVGLWWSSTRSPTIEPESARAAPVASIDDAPVAPIDDAPRTLTRAEQAARDRQARLELQALALEEARALLAARKWDEALTRLERAQDRSSEAWVLRGRILADRFQYLPDPEDEAQAIVSFRTVLKQLAPDHREANVRLALLQPDHAPTALRIAEGGPPPLAALALVGVARGRYLAQRVDTERFKLAYAEVIRALQLDPDCSDAWTSLLKLFAIVFSGGSPLSPELRRDWSWALNRLKSPRLATSPRVQAILGYALNSSAGSGVRLQRAEQALTRAIGLEPRLAFAWRVRGQVRIKQGIFPSGLADLEQAARLSPWTREILEDLGQGYLQSGDLERADAVLTQAIRAAPQRARAYGLRSGVRRRQGRRAEADDDLAKARSLSKGQ